MENLVPGVKGMGGRGYLSGTGEAISALTNGDAEHELLHLNLPHWVRLLLVRRLRNREESTHSDAQTWCLGDD
jgi:hypothetical protein